MELIGGNIRRFVANRMDAEAAEAMMTGSLFAGLAFSFARLGNVHAMSHPVSACFHVPHGTVFLCKFKQLAFSILHLIC